MNQESWSEKRGKYLEKYFSWLHENEPERYDSEEDARMDSAAFFAAEDELSEWRKAGQ